MPPAAERRVDEHAVSQMSHTMSYGLLLFGLGLCVTLLYLMFY